MCCIKKNKVRLEVETKKQQQKICYMIPSYYGTPEEPKLYYLLFNGKYTVYTFENVQRHKTQFTIFKF